MTSETSQARMVNKMFRRTTSFCDPEKVAGVSIGSLEVPFCSMTNFKTSSGVVTPYLKVAESPGRQLLAWDSTAQRNRRVVSSMGGSSANGTQQAKG